MIGPIPQRRRLLPIGLLWLLPLLIGAGAGFVAYQVSPEPASAFAATLTLRPPATVQNSAAEVNLFVNDLSQEAMSDSVRLYVLDRVPDLDSESYLQDVTVARQGSTSWVDITFVDPDASIALDTVNVLAMRLLDEAARQEFDRANFMAENASGRLDTAEAALIDFSRERSLFDPEVEYRALIDEISRLEAEILQARAEELEEEEVEEMVQETNRLEVERIAMGESLLEFERLSAAVATARSDLQQSLSDLEEAEFDYLNANAPAELIGGRELVPHVDDSARLQRTALAAFMGLVLGLAVVVPTAWLLQRRRSGGRHVDLDRESILGSGQLTGEAVMRQLSDHRQR